MTATTAPRPSLAERRRRDHIRAVAALHLYLGVALALASVLFGLVAAGPLERLLGLEDQPTYVVVVPETPPSASTPPATP